MDTIKSKGLFWQIEGQPILKGINLEFEKGGFYGIIGPNGSGKTSFLRHILRFIKAKEDVLFVEDKDILSFQRLELSRKMALVPQNTHMETAFSVYDIVLMGRNPYQKRLAGSSREDIEKTEEAMRLASCYHLKDKRYSSLSGGEAQRVMIARAIAQDTPWLLLDEPVSNLDIKHQIVLMETLKQLNEQRKVSVIVVLHDVNLAAAYCGKIVMMKDGIVYFAGDIKQGMTEEHLLQVYGISFVAVRHPLTGQAYFIPGYTVTK